MSEYLFTCTPSFPMKIKKDITKHDFVQLCRKISNELNQYYKTLDNMENHRVSLNHNTDVQILPENTVENRLIFTNYNNDNPESKKWYKSMRLYIKDKDYHDFRWSRVPNDIMNEENEWVNSTDILIPKNTSVEPWLKNYENHL